MPAFRVSIQKLLSALLLLTAVFAASGRGQIVASVDELLSRWRNINQFPQMYERAWETNNVIELMYRHEDPKAVAGLKTLYSEANSLETRAHILRSYGLRGSAEDFLFAARELADLAGSDTTAVFALREMIDRCVDGDALVLLADNAVELFRGRELEHLLPLLMARVPRREGCVADLRAMLKRVNGELSGLAAVALSKWEDTDSAADVIKLAKGDLQQRMCAAEALGWRMADAACNDALRKLTQDRYWQTRLKAFLAIAEHGSKEDLVYLCDALASEERPRIQYDLAAALAEKTGKSYGTQWKAWKYWFLKNEEGNWENKSDDTAEYWGYKITSGHVVFVIDVSGSMQARYTSKTRLDIAKEELLKVLDKLDDGMRFNIIAFNHEIKPFYAEGLVPANAKMKRVASKWVQDLVAEGGTNTYDALDMAFNKTEADTIYFLSDGMPSTGKYIYPFKIRMDVAAWNRDSVTQLHCIGLLVGLHMSERGSHLDGAQDFLQDLSKANSGQCVIRRD